MKKLLLTLVLGLLVSTAFGAQIVKDSEFDFPDTTLTYYAFSSIGAWTTWNLWGAEIIDGIPGTTAKVYRNSGWGYGFGVAPSWAAAGLSQLTGEVFHADTVYTMSIRWYDSVDNFPLTPDVESIAINIASVIDPTDPCDWTIVAEGWDGIPAALDTLQDFSMTFDTATNPGIVGTQIGVGYRLTSSLGSWTYIDYITLTYPSAGDPDPADGATVDPSLAELSWSDPPSPVGTLTSEVYLGEPNFLFAVLLTDPCDTDNSVPVSLSANETYEWRVHITDSGTGKTSISPVWSFNTINEVPLVDAGLNQSAWLSGGSASADLTGNISDDDVPVSPGTVTYTWTMQSGPAALTGNTDPAGTVPNDPCDNEVSTTVSFDTVGTYVIKLDGTDSVLATSDTVTVYVYAEGDLGLVAHWPLDTDYDDTEAGAHHGTPAGDAAIDPNFQVGTGSVRLDGNDYVDLGGGTTDPNFTTWASPLDNTKMSVSCWIKSNGLGDGWGGIVSKGNTGWKIQQNGTFDDVSFTVNGVAAAYSDGGAALDSLTDGKWHHIVGVFMTDATHIYVDGILGGTGLWTSEDPPEIGIDDLYIGSHQDNPGLGFIGHIDDVKLFQNPLSGPMVLAEFIAGGGTNSCGGVYAAADINEDCHNDLKDVAALSAAWLECTDVSDPACD